MDLEKDLPPVQAKMETRTTSKSTIRTSEASFFRDEKSRTRIEHGDIASIHDPMSGKKFLLNPRNKIAIPGAPKPPEMPALSAPQMPGFAAPAMPQLRATADLAEKTTDGIKVSGKQFEAPVPGKPQPLTSEVWTSHDLKLPIHSTVTDPSTCASQTMQMKNVTPGVKLDPAMFPVPADFKIVPPHPPPIPKKT